MRPSCSARKRRRPCCPPSAPAAWSGSSGAGTRTPGTTPPGTCARVFASGQLLPVSQYLVGLENKRLKREQLQQLLEAGWRAAAEALLAAYGKPDPADIPGAEELRRGLTVRAAPGPDGADEALLPGVPL